MQLECLLFIVARNRKLDLTQRTSLLSQTASKCFEGLPVGSCIALAVGTSISLVIVANQWHGASGVVTTMTPLILIYCMSDPPPQKVKDTNSKFLFGLLWILVASSSTAKSAIEHNGDVGGVWRNRLLLLQPHMIIGIAPIILVLHSGYRYRLL